MGFRAAGTPIYTAAHTGTNAQNVDMPTCSVGDLLLMFAIRSTSTVTWTTPAGWTSVPNLMTNRVSSDAYSTFFAYRVAVGDEGASVALTNNNGASTTANQSAVIVAYDNPALDVTPTTSHRVQVNENNRPTPPAIVTETAGATVVVFQNTSNAEITTAGAPSGFTLRVNHTPFAEGNILVADMTAGAAGTVTPGAWTHTTSAEFGDGSTLTIALEPAPTPTINNIDGDNTVGQGQSNVVINMANVPTSVASWSATLGGVSLTAVAWGTNQTATVSLPSGQPSASVNSTLNVTYTE
jgi:hypothetical protein